MFDQLQIMADRYEELGGLLSDPEVVNNTKRFMALSKEEASLRETVAAYARYVEVTTGISDAEEMLSDSSLDADEADMFKEELKALKAEKATLEEDIKILLLPKDPNDDKNIILEIRGAAGGDEAALFAGDLLAMYQKQRLRGVSIPQQQRCSSCLKSKISTSTLTRKTCGSTSTTLLVPADRTSIKSQQPFGSSMNRRVSRWRCRKNGINRKTVTRP